MKFFSVEVDKHIAIVTLDRAPINALVKQCYVELKQVFEEIGQIKDARVAILKSEGPYFCPGNDVKEFTNFATSEEAMEYSQIVNEGLISVYNCEIPVIAAVHGHAFGAGMAIAACSDVIIAADTAEFAIPEIKVGVIGAAGFLSLIVPEKVVRYMSLSGEPLSAQKIEQYGGIHKVVPVDNVFNSSLEVANILLKRGPTALRYFKQAMNINQQAQLEEQCAVERSFARRYIGSEEANESVNAFIQKRSADYSNSESK